MLGRGNIASYGHVAKSMRRNQQDQKYERQLKGLPEYIDKEFRKKFVEIASKHDFLKAAFQTFIRRVSPQDTGPEYHFCFRVCKNIRF